MTSVVRVNIWGRVFSLRVKYRCHKGETPTKKQVSAFDWFVKQVKTIEKSRKNVEDFCRKQVLLDDENQKKDNVFSYVMPDYVFIDREDNPNVAIMCHYRYDPEHGLAVVFDYKGNVTVGIQDIIL